MKPVAEISDPEVWALATQAQAYVEQFGWCEAVRSCSLGFAIAGVLGVFRVDFVARGAGVDPTVWAVVGDVPPAYLAYDDGDTWQDALRGYVYEMERWVAAVRAGKSTDDLIPVSAPATALNADLLDRRLTFVRERLLDVDPASVQGDT